MKKLYVTIAAALLAAMPLTQGYAQDKPIKIGFLGLFSGAGADQGEGMMPGVNLAIKEINAAGGVLGRKLEVVTRDEMLKPEVAVAAARELVNAEKVDVLLGPMGAGDALAVSEVSREARILNFSPTTNTEVLTGEKFHKYVFQLSATSDVDARNFVEIMKRIGSKKVCLTGYDYAYSIDLFKELRKIMPANIQVTNEYLAKLSTSDYNALVGQLIADPCDTVLSLFFGGGFISLVKQAEPFGLFKAKKAVSGGANGDYLIAAALKDKFPEGLWSHAHDLWYADNTPQLKAFHEAMAKQTGRKEFHSYGLPAYISVYFIAEAIKKAGKTDSDALVAAMENMTVNTPLGPLSADPKTHRIGKPNFYGPIVTVPGSDVKHMSPAELLR